MALSKGWYFDVFIAFLLRAAGWGFVILGALTIGMQLLSYIVGAEWPSVSVLDGIAKITGNAAVTYESSWKGALGLREIFDFLPFSVTALIIGGILCGMGASLRQSADETW